MVGAERPAPGGGLLLAFEGIDGSGKSTQVQRCADWLRAAMPGRAVAVLREPGGTPLGEAVRRILLADEAISPLAEMLLYMAARAELYQHVVLPALASGSIVLLDRSQYSTAAYQGAGLGLDAEEILSLARTVTAGRRPDRVVLFDIRPELARERLTGRNAPPEGAARSSDRIEQRDVAYFRRVAESYRAMAAADPARFAVVNAADEPASVEAAVRAALQPILGAAGAGPGAGPAVGHGR